MRSSIHLVGGAGSVLDGARGRSDDQSHRQIERVHGRLSAVRGTCSHCPYDLVSQGHSGTVRERWAPWVAVTNVDAEPDVRRTSLIDTIGENPYDLAKSGRRTLLRTSGLERHFGGLKAVDGVDFSLDQGEVRAIIGPNGAGKTTFVSLLCGRVPPSRGTILFEGSDVTRPPRLSAGWSRNCLYVSDH